VLALHRAGKAEEAAKRWQEALPGVRRTMESATKYREFVGVNWPVRLELELLSREVEQLLKELPPPAPR
jgi:hypothetical protein